MTTDFTIDGTAISSFGFKLKEVNGHLGVGEPKQQGTPADVYTSANYQLTAYVQKSPEVLVSFFGAFATIELAEAAIYAVYGLLVNPGERHFIHTNGTAVVQFMGVMHKGAEVAYQRKGAGLVFDVKLKLLKTNDFTE